jgi:hypothetical protein
MTQKIIILENRKGTLGDKLRKVMRLIPTREKGDKKLQRLLAFRLNADDEDTVSKYLMDNIKKIIQCSYTGNFYDIIKNNAIKKECGLID